LLACTAARAQSSPIVLHEGVTCLREETLDAQLEPGVAGVLAHESLTLRVDGSDEDPRSAVIRLLRADASIAERSFSPGPPRCADFHAAIAVTIGIMVRSVIVEPPPAPPEPEPPPPPPAPRLPPPAPSRVEMVRPLSVALRVGGSLGWGVGAIRSRGVAAELEVAGRHWALRGGALATFSRQDHFDEVDAGYETKLRAGSLDACWRVVRTPRVLADLCAGLLLGGLHGRGVSDSQPVNGKSYLWPALRAELDVALRLFGDVWATASISPLRGLQPIILTAGPPDAPADRAELPRSGVLLGFGLAYELLSQGLPTERHR
jgi:hypothetical protein